MEKTFELYPNVLVLRFPDFCPVCEHAAEVNMVSSEPDIFPKSGDLLRQRAQVVFQCPRDSCSAFFIGQFWWDSTEVISHAPSQGSGVRVRGSKAYGYKRKFFPTAIANYETTEEIKKVSSSFVEIATQASQAEAEGLNEIAGMGFRKALEFLIKDFCIFGSPTEKESIEEKLLGKVIGDHVSNHNVKECAKHASWLGNDETHYKRRWTEHNINDLKTLIKLTESWITNELQMKKYQDDFSASAQ